MSAEPFSKPHAGPQTPAAATSDTGIENFETEAWHALRPVGRGPGKAMQTLRDRSDGVRQATDVLRTQLLQTLKSERISRVAVTAPSSGCGTTFTTVNLALSMAAIADVGTVLLDLNQRHPGVGKALGHNTAQIMADLLSGKVSFMDYLLRYDENFAVGLNAQVPPNPAELLQSQSAADMLDELTGFLTPDVILCDMPPLLEYDDVMAFLPQVDGVLLVVDATRTLGREIARCQKMLEGRAPLLGVVLNRGRGRRRKRPGAGASR